MAQVRAIRAARRRDGSPDWRAAAWLLKHSSADGFGPHSRMRKAKAQEQEGAAPNENCANLAETPPDAGRRAGQPQGARPDEPASSGTMAPQNRAILAETPGGHLPEPCAAGPRLSRRERREEERRVAKANRVARTTAL